MKSLFEVNPELSHQKVVAGSVNGSISDSARRINVRRNKWKVLRIVTVLVALAFTRETAAFSACSLRAAAGADDKKSGTALKSPVKKGHRAARRKKDQPPCGVASARPDVKDASEVVKVQVVIDEHGDVISAIALSGRKDLRERAEKEARAKTFEPATLNGTSVKRIRDLTFDYSVKK